ncbi:MAG TPA: hypothetical protein VJQ45_06235 [Ktedonobacterales bacterium]|nr:hypothetical protein [Ktedonobacterales bacterium]
MTARSDQTLLDQPRHGVQVATPATTGDAAAAQSAQSVRASEVADVIPSAIMFAGAAAVGAAALFTTGLMRRRGMHTLRGMAVDALEIRIPLWLPVTLLEIAREVFFYWRATSAANADLHPTSEAGTHPQA